MNSALQLHQASMRSVMARRFVMTKVRKAKTVVAITREPKYRQRAATDYPSQRWQPCTFAVAHKAGGACSLSAIQLLHCATARLPRRPASAEAPAQRLDITPDHSGVILVEAAAR